MRRLRTAPPALILSLALVSKSNSSAHAFGADCFSRSNHDQLSVPTLGLHTHAFTSCPLLAFARSPDDQLISDDEEAVREQLGYLPSNFFRVTSYTLVGKQPVSIQTYPLNGGAVRRKTKAKGDLTPFPTLYWLANAEISRAVAELERRGFVGVLEERLRSDDSYVRDYIAAHQMYAKERWQSLTDHDHAMLVAAEAGEQGDEGDGCGNDKITPGMVRMIRNSGIAGRIPPFEPCIKCLHSHYAHYRSGGEMNVVGKWVGDLLLEEFHDLDL